MQAYLCVGEYSSIPYVIQGLEMRVYCMEELCYDSLENSGNCYDLYSGVMENGFFCPLLFKSYAVMANRGVISSLQPAVDCVFHTAGGRSMSDASVAYEETEVPEQTGKAETTEETEA